MSVPLLFKRGDIVNTGAEIAVIVDVLRSNETENVCIYISFPRNIGNGRSYDMLEWSPDRERILGVGDWTLATRADLDKALARRQVRLSQEIAEMIAICPP